MVKFLTPKYCDLDMDPKIALGFVEKFDRSFWQDKYFFFFFKFDVYVQLCGLWQTMDMPTYMLRSSLALSPFLSPFLLYLTAIIVLSANFGLNPSEFIQAILHLLGRSSSPILALFPLLLSLLLPLLPLNIWLAASTLSHLPAGRPAPFFWLELTM